MHCVSITLSVTTCARGLQSNLVRLLDAYRLAVQKKEARPLAGRRSLADHARFTFSDFYRAEIACPAFGSRCAAFTLVFSRFPLLISCP